MLEQIEKSNHKNKKNVPKGCFDVELLDKYISIKNFLNIKDMYNIVAPFRYQFLSYVIVKKKDPIQGEVLDLYHEVSKKFILRAVPKTGQIGSKFLVYSAQNFKVVARVRGDLLGTKFFVFDGGHNPSRKKIPTRKQLAYVYINNTQFFSQKPPNITALLANHTKRSIDDDQIQTLGTLFQADGIVQLQQTTSQLQKAQKQKSTRVYSISSIQPVYCPSKKGYVMDLKGLITQPSPTNIVMKTSTNLDCFVMGKRSENTYLMYVGNPLTLVQGFGVFLVNYAVKKD